MADEKAVAAPAKAAPAPAVALTPDQEKVLADLTARKATFALNPVEEKQMADLIAQQVAFASTPGEVMRRALQALIDRKLAVAHDIATKQGGFPGIVVTPADVAEIMEVAK